MASLAPSSCSLRGPAIDLYDVVEHPGESLTTSSYSSQSKSASSLNRVASASWCNWSRPHSGTDVAAAVEAARRGVGGADVLSHHRVVDLVDAVDQHEPRLGEVVGRAHDHGPAVRRAGRVLSTLRHEARFVAHVPRGIRPFATGNIARIRGIDAFNLLCPSGEGELPLAVLAHRLHEGVGGQQREVERQEPPRIRWHGSIPMASGWPTSKVPICAPRRPPADDTVKHILS